MKPLLLFACIIHSYAVLSQVNQSDREAVKEVLINSFDQVLSKYDTSKIYDYYSEDLIVLEDGEVWNMDTVKTLFKKALAQKVIPGRINTLDFIDVRVSDNMAWVAYDNKAEFRVGDKIVRKAHWLESAVLHKTNEVWRIKMLHSTVISNDTL